MANEGGKFQFAIDRGGTFTDVFAKCPSGEVRVMKLLSVDPKNYNDAPVSETTQVPSFFLKASANMLRNIKLSIIHRLREFGESSRPSLVVKCLVSKRLTPAKLNGFEWVRPWQRMLFWREKEKELPSLCLRDSGM